MYCTIQSWNANETRLILYGNTYTFIRTLDDINPDNIEAIFRHFTNPEILFYIDNNTNYLISYNVENQEILTGLTVLTDCTEGVTGGNDV